MPCIPIKDGFLCCNRFFRLPLMNGDRVFMEWHSYCGPTFFRDRNRERLIENWWDNDLICAALDWFQGRGKKA